VIAFFIIVACAATLCAGGIRITDAKDAAVALPPSQDGGRIAAEVSSHILSVIMQHERKPCLIKELYYYFILLYFF